MSQPVEQGDHNQVRRPATFRWRFIATEGTRSALVREMILERFRRFPLLLAITIVAAVALAVGVISVVLELPFNRLTGVIMIAILVGPVVVQPIRSFQLSNQTTEQFFTSGYEYEGVNASGSMGSNDTFAPFNFSHGPELGVAAGCSLEAGAVW